MIQEGLKGVRVITVANEKGGSGKSTVAIHLAVALLRAGQRVATIDLDTRQRTFSRYFDTSVFARPGRGERGSGAAASRYAFRGPGINNWDLTFFKNIPVKERFALQFRWEMYNAFNHTQFNGVDATARFDAQGRQINTRFGEITSSRSARFQQLALRLSF